MARIAVDVDSTLYDFVALARGVMGEMGGQLRKAAYAEWSEWRTPMDIAGDAWPDVVELCHKPDVILAQEPFPGARETLRELEDAGHEIIYASNRDPSTRAATSKWLGMHDFPGLDFNVRCHLDDKLSMVRDCQYLIDDRPKTLVQFIHGSMDVKDVEGGDYVAIGRGATGRKAFGLVTPYNRALTDVPGIYLAPTWPLLAAYLQAKISGSVRTNC